MTHPTGIWSTLPRPIKALAPMENVTDTVFRRFVASCGRPDVFFTEFTNVDHFFTKQHKRAVHRLEYTEAERPLIAQIWGANPQKYYEGAQYIASLGFDGIDINMGCPSPKIRRKKTCAGLIKDPPLASELIKATQEGSGDLPVSVKTRMGFDRVVTEEWCGFLLEHDLAALTLHGRLAKDMSRFPADWDEIHKVVRLRDQMGLDTPVLGNGDVTSLQEIDEKVEKYGVDGVMIGRGIFQDPHLFDPHRALTDMDANARIDLLLAHTRLFVDTWGDAKDFNIMKKFFKIYTADFEGALPLRDALMQQPDFDGVLAVLEEAGFAT